jgi:4-azaleucine resistance transporter AzlC
MQTKAPGVQANSLTVSFTLTGAVAGARQSVPLLIAIFSYGAVFGVLARQAGLSLAESTLMSGIVFAGASQFASLDLWMVPLPVMTIILTTLALNLRFVLMGASLRPWFQSLPNRQAYLSTMFLGDESWALAMRDFASGGKNGAFLIGSGIAQYVVWVGSTAAGHMLGRIVNDPSRWALDFVFTAAFAALLIGMWRSKSDALPWIVSAAVAIAVSLLLPGKWYILLGGLAGSIAGALGVKNEN